MAGTLASAALLFACVDAKDPYDNTGGSGGSEAGYGTVQFNQIQHDDAWIEYSAGSKADPEQDVNSYIVSIVNPTTGEVVVNGITGERYTWTYAEVSGQVITIPSGKYKVVAKNLATEPLADWETPYFYGESDMTVKISELTRVNVTCSRANVGVTVQYDQTFIDRVDNPYVQVYMDYTDPATATKYKADLEFPIDEERIGYFQVPADGMLYVLVSGIRKEDGQALQDQHFIIPDVKASNKINVNVKYQQTGEGSLSVGVDVTVDERPVEVEVPDGEGVIDGGDGNENWENPDPGPGPEPGDEISISGYSFNGSAFDIDQTLNLEFAFEQNYVIDIEFDVPAGIAELWVNIDSKALEPLLPDYQLYCGTPFDIANLPDYTQGGADWVYLLSNPQIGLIDLSDPIKGKTNHIFSIGGLMEMLAAAALGLDPVPDMPGTHLFHLRVKDNNGNEQTATLTLYMYME